MPPAILGAHLVAVILLLHLLPLIADPRNSDRDSRGFEKLWPYAFRLPCVPLCLGSPLCVNCGFALSVAIRTMPS
jgi:hypothetical protein